MNKNDKEASAFDGIVAGATNGALKQNTQQAQNQEMSAAAAAPAAPVDNKVEQAPAPAPAPAVVSHLDPF